MERKVANVYEDTRALLNQVKDEFDFKSDDQAIKFLCQMFIADNRNEVLKRYIDVKRKAAE
ncbi:hypothetical protein PAECIP112173_00322 [Paenibacillus sp. JJ-100]|uniref:hypothetical protein n=1 Tax=Paenibacillus sp. JJ-100 TaxID=2974896 RepID=UPI0022FF8861|nr:hypothetical protein [Paenibacillus sp. JJ-100]CAI6022875.1 hypothetical protein PAECIP112173_00322 [Paenibacillus sp. JJ-100]